MKRLSTFLLILLISSITVHAATKGKIKGSITDADTGEPLIGANVIIQGTSQGAATDLDGNFLILAVSPGVYKLRASMIGYETMIQTQVIVEVDRTIIIDFQPFKINMLTGRQIGFMRNFAGIYSHRETTLTQKSHTFFMGKTAAIRGFDLSILNILGQ